MSDDWDTADTATSMPDEPQETPRAVPPVEASPQSITKPMQSPIDPVPPAPPPPAPARGAAAALANATAAMSPAAREEVWVIVRAAVDQAVAPVLARQKEIEARLERAAAQVAAAQASAIAQAASQAAPATLASRAGSTATARLASIPVQMGSLSPTPPPARADTAPTSSTVPDMRSPLASQPPRTTSARPSLPATGYGVVVVPPAVRASLDLEGVSFSADEMKGFDGGKSKRRVVTFVVVVLLAVAIFAVTMTILSHSGNAPI
jgi:hypothetical protein